MKIVIIGAGLIGVTAAYFLKRAGHEVLVIDRNDGPGHETSFANGSLLTPSMSEPWNSPGCWRTLLRSLVQVDAALQVRLAALPTLAGWGIEFLRNSTALPFQRNTLNNLSLALYSREIMRVLRQEVRLEYDHRACGSLRMFRDPAAWEKATAAIDHLMSKGVTARPLSASETVAMNPALAPIAAQLAGAIHYEVDEIGNAYSFCQGLATEAERLGAEFLFGVQVSQLNASSARIESVVANGKKIVADLYVVAAASHSTLLLRQVGINLPVRPAKGYSVTIEQVSDLGLRVPVIDDEVHAAIVPIGGGVRIVGTAEFAGYDLSIRPERILHLCTLLKKVLPQLSVDFSAAKQWCGLRPMSSDGVPIIGKTRIPNLFVSTGHGHLGWTMAAGSAQLLVDLVENRTAAIDPSPFTPSRFFTFG